METTQEISIVKRIDDELNRIVDFVSHMNKLVLDLETELFGEVLLEEKKELKSNCTGKLGKWLTIIGEIREIITEDRNTLIRILDKFKYQKEVK